MVEEIGFFLLYNNNNTIFTAKEIYFYFFGADELKFTVFNFLWGGYLFLVEVTCQYIIGCGVFSLTIIGVFHNSNRIMVCFIFQYFY